MEIRIDDLCGAEIANFIEEHVREIAAIVPPDSQQALELTELQQPEITVWTVWQDDRLIGCGAIKEVSAELVEIKSLRIAAAVRGQGVASILVEHILRSAKQRGYRQIALETGSAPYFEPARNLYCKYGFKYCAPFANYCEDPVSIFMMRDL